MFAHVRTHRKTSNKNKLFFNCGLTRARARARHLAPPLSHAHYNNVFTTTYFHRNKDRIIQFARMNINEQQQQAGRQPAAAATAIRETAATWYSAATASIEFNIFQRIVATRYLSRFGASHNLKKRTCCRTCSLHVVCYASCTVPDTRHHIIESTSISVACTMCARLFGIMVYRRWWLLCLACECLHTILPLPVLLRASNQTIATISSLSLSQTLSV